MPEPEEAKCRKQKGSSWDQDEEKEEKLGIEDLSQGLIIELSLVNEVSNILCVS